MSPTLPQGLPARRRRHHLLARLIFHPFSGLRTFKVGGTRQGEGEKEFGSEYRSLIARLAKVYF